MSALLILSMAGGFFYVLFALAARLDRRASGRADGQMAAVVYALSLAVYCTSWTFYGSVGRAAESGASYFAVYAGPILLFVFGRPVLAKIIAVAKEQHSTSIADFLSARYARSRLLAGLATVIAVLGIMPYVSLQLKAISATFGMLTHYPSLLPVGAGWASKPFWADPAFYVTVLMAAFCWLFGTRQIDASEQHRGLVTAVALESVVKLLAFLAAGAFALWGLQDGWGALVEQAMRIPSTARLLDWQGHLSDINWWSVALASTVAIFCLPRQFQVLVVENVDRRHLRTAGWLFPLYLIAINLFVIPIALTGTLQLGDSGVSADMFVLALPILGGQPGLALFVFIGGLSAATAMVLMETIALATMISNDLIMPVVLRRLMATDAHTTQKLVKGIRRTAIIAVLLLAYTYARLIGESFALINFGLISFAAAAQFAPPILGGLYWRGARKEGAIAGLAAGFLVWCYTLLLPSFAHSGWLPLAVAETGLLGLAMLAPHALFGIGGMDHFTHGLVWSLLANMGGFVLASILFRPQDAGHGGDLGGWGDCTATIGELQSLVARFAGFTRTQQAFAEFCQVASEPPDAGKRVPPDMVIYAERLLAGAIGAASAREVLAWYLEPDARSAAGRLAAPPKMDVSRGILVDALDHLGQGVVVIDANFRLCACNRKFQELFKLPAQLIVHGAPMADIIRHNAHCGEYGECEPEAKVAERMGLLRQLAPHRSERERPDGTVLEVIGTPLPNGGFVTSYLDVTRRQRAEQQLRQSYEQLEHRVAERTTELRQEILARTHTETALRSSRERLKAIADSLFEGVLVVNREGFLVFANASAKLLLECRKEAEGLPLDELLLLRAPGGDLTFAAGPWQQVVSQGVTVKNEDAAFITQAGACLSIAYACSPLWEEGNCRGAIISFRDIDALKRAQREAEQSSRLASVGQLAAGIAHEINTPVQYIGDNLRFIGQSIAELVSACRPVVATAEAPSDMDFLIEELPLAVQQSLDGVEQISRIVLSMKEFSHPGTTHKVMTDINRALENTLTVSRNVWKHAAEVERDFAPTLPSVLCYPGELGQVFLNLIINAAQAIEECGNPLPGKIMIATRQLGQWVEIRISDTGPGIAPAIRDKIFDPFFTTKEVGKGSGQGLAISRDVVVTKHGGQIEAESRNGRGTTFILRLPVEGSEACATDAS